MNKNQDYPSDSDQSDEDFCPNDESDSDIPSEEESDYKGSDSEEEEIKQKKSLKNKGKSRKSTRTTKSPEVQESVNKVNGKLDEQEPDEEEKKRSDELWASFLSDVNDSPSVNESQISSSNSNETKSEKEIVKSKDISKNNLEEVKQQKTVKVTEILEFAGEEIEVTKEVIQTKDSETGNSSDDKQKKNGGKVSKFPVKRPASGGLSTVLNQIGKKNKLSVLEKTKLDWEGFKQKEGLKEELKTFNKGKDGYLERQDFLQRTDLRQFEIEKGLRQTKRKF